MAQGFVQYGSRDGYILHNVPAAHLRHIRRRADTGRTSVANVVGRILAARYDIEFVPSARASKQPTSTTLSLRLPPAVMNRVRDEATERGVTIRTVLLDALSDEFRLKRPEPTLVGPGGRPGRPPSPQRRKR